MNAARQIAVFEDARYRLHETPPGHPERAERLVSVAEAIETRAGHVDRRPVRPATDAELLAVHPRAHIQRVEETARRAPARFDADTYVSSASAEVARLAAGAAVEAARSVATGAARCALAAVRPPGHHAEADRAMGFCLYNNIAIAARAVRERDGVERILIFDWDVHHGNGTQHLFESDRDTLYVSTHQFPFYPGTGAVDETGRGAGEGATINVPLPAGCGDSEYLGALHRVLVPAARWFRPQLILVSCGFDAHYDDPLAAMEVSGAGFVALTRIVRGLADDLCEGRVAFILEGGYAPTGLREGTGAVLDVMSEASAGPIAPPPPLEVPSPLSLVLERLRAVHSSRVAGIGASS